MVEYVVAIDVTRVRFPADACSLSIFRFFQFSPIMRFLRVHAVAPTLEGEHENNHGREGEEGEGRRGRRGSRLLRSRVVGGL